MNVSNLVINNQIFYWYTVHNDEHPDFCLVDGEEEIWVQIYLGEHDLRHNERYLKSNELQAITDNTARDIIKKLINMNYLTTYNSSDVGLIYSETGDLLEN